MDITTIMQAISTVGFPIVACAACFWMINKQDERHREEINKMTDSLNANTLAITKLTAILQGGDTHGE